MRKLGLRREEIGGFSLLRLAQLRLPPSSSPSASKESWVDGAIPITTVYARMLKVLPYAEETPGLQEASSVGVHWGRATGEETAVRVPRRLAVDGIHSVIEVLEEIEVGKFHDIDFIECQACRGGVCRRAADCSNPFRAGSI